ncbi:RNA polymerase sigma-70 factor, ECF subfamily [Singulisphaera sp. GP187]|uniref:sigma-70 family RNA polymerase sigma factor n=1 Tax=Singulisphaera sp. GP187 TaxID=1882752 RepID=UPI0009264884|nr:sigma-70 family RNA polymerase sigma factor [Singulisphaera sp. GP187]SIO38841.1 RNA polymerase sigma-70 factor, ECF subfamily [Singulisphaera sp. GP187]
MVGPSGLKDLGRLFSEGTDAGQSDVRLLERFVAHRDEAAFSALVTRHGPMVLGVCRRLLRDSNDVDDAFQAVFLVLVRRSGSLRDGDRLASWLYGVAYRVSLRARANTAQRLGRERPAIGVEALAIVPAPDRDQERRELLAVLDEEVTRLPDPSRAVVVLCDLDGLTHEQAATRLECPVGTVKSRLASARARLRSRLTRRGLAPALAATGSGLLGGQASAASPSEALVVRIVRAAAPHLTGMAGVAEVGLVPATVAALVEGELAMMATLSWKSLAALLIVSGTVATGAVVSLARPIPVSTPTPPGALQPPLEPPRIPQPEPTLVALNAEPDSPLSLVNPGVEEGDERQPNGWSKGNAIRGVSYLWSRDTAHEGKASLCLKKSENRYFPIAEWSQTVTRTGDSPRLKVSAWIKADRAGKAILDAQFLDRKGEWSHAWVAYIGAKESGDPPVTHDWKRYEGVVAIPPGTAKIVIAPQIYGPGTVWFDDLGASYTTDAATDPLTR